MPTIADPSVISAKWRRRVAGAQQDYKDGVTGTQKDWQALTAAANSNFKTGVQTALAADRFLTGVQKAGTNKWRTNAATKGPGRWSEGCQLAGDAYAAGFGPYAAVIANVQLPARGPRGAAVNYQRSQVLGQALNTARVGRK